ncbi:MAG: glucose-1-phosphate adenylyltransferase [Proteobacteria bacterium]|nr:glucose-1-phosphate adenylyltransferase [Pseudomonadota bacterium]MCC6632778.1 glucose-1-phosphate adenylyltransferase [Gammaproteobacteria bacterium]
MVRLSRTSSGRYVSRLTGGTLAMIMAGGRGERLRGLTEHRCKPATPFGGKFRIVDFVLSNCVNSGIRKICLLTQYKGQSLIQHVQRGWSYLRGEFGEFIDVIPAQQQVGKHWYRGTADCVYQNLDYVRQHHPQHVLVLAGDHIYKMDYGPMIAYHVEKGADITVGVVEVPVPDAREFGVLSVTEWNRVTKFAEKPANPEPMPGNPNVALASMGIYIFNAQLIEQLLVEDAADETSAHDFGKNIIPKSIEKLQVFAYPFRNVRTRAQNYWRDVGTVDAFYEANLELVHVSPELNVYDEEWPIWTYQVQQPPAKFVLDDEGRCGMAINSLVAGGSIISGAVVRNSLLFSAVRVDERSQVERSVVMPGVHIGRGCIIRNAIIDEHCDIPDGTQIGVNLALDRERFDVTPRGVVLVTPEALLASTIAKG